MPAIIKVQENTIVMAIVAINGSAIAAIPSRIIKTPKTIANAEFVLVSLKSSEVIAFPKMF
jgi:hypothetical protein